MKIKLSREKFINWLASGKRAVMVREIPRLKIMKVLITESEDICMQRRHGLKQRRGKFSNWVHANLLFPYL